MPPTWERRLEVLRALYVIVKEPFGGDHLADRVRELGRSVVDAARRGDQRQLRELGDEIHIWLQRMAQPILSRMTRAFRPEAPRKPWQ